MLKLEWVASMGWVSVFQRFSISAFQRVFSRPGVGFVHSSLRQDASLEAGEGANRLTKHAPATRCRKNDGSTLANLPAGDTPRVSLRSPVREYCTPGSVRGAPGNRCPYLDTIMRARDWAIIRPTRRWACKRVARPRPWPGWFAWNGSSIEFWGEERTLTPIFQGSCAPG